MLLSEVSNGRNNNLNIIRFIAAIMVIFSHSFPLSSGTYNIEPLYVLTGGQTDFGNFAVCVFFFFSGFLINRTVHKGQSGYAFFKARCLRIFPCLAVVVILCAFVLGCSVTTYSLKEYLASPGTYQYLLNIVFVPKHSLPGVFEENQGSPVNGALWTLRVEFLCYITCYILWKMGLSEKRRMKYLILPFLITYFVSCYIIFAKSPAFRAALRACGIFYCGMIYYTYREFIRINRLGVLLCGVGLALSSAAHLYDIGLLFCLPYILAYLAFGTRIKWSTFGEKTEISYGIYLCAFPIQQTITMLFGGSMTPWLNFFMTLPLALIGGFLLNILVEKPLMRRVKPQERTAKQM